MPSLLVKKINLSFIQTLVCKGNHFLGGFRELRRRPLKCGVGIVLTPGITVYGVGFFKIGHLHQFIHDIFGDVFEDTVFFKNDVVGSLKIDHLVDKLDRQVKKHKEKITNHLHNKHNNDFSMEDAE